MTKLGLAALMALMIGCMSDELEDPDRRDVIGDIEGIEGLTGAGTLDVPLPARFTAAALGGEERIVLAWTLEDGSAQLGVLSTHTGSFQYWTSHARSTSAPLSIAVGGPPSDQRVYVAWVESNPWQLMLLVLDTDGHVVRQAAPIASAVNAVAPSLSGTDEGVLVGYVWSDDDSQPHSWDPWVANVDLDGQLRSTEQVAAVPRQTLGLTIAAAHDGSYAAVYADSGTRRFHLRRYGTEGPLEAAIDTGRETVSGFDPWARIVDTDGSIKHWLVVGLPDQSELAYRDTRLAKTPVAGGQLELGGSLGETIDTFAPPVASMNAVVFDGAPGVVAVWEQVVERDPEWDGCTLAPPVHTQLITQRLVVNGGVQMLGEPSLIREWRSQVDGTLAPSGSVIVSSSDSASYTVLWSEGLLQFRSVEP